MIHLFNPHLRPRNKKMMSVYLDLIDGEPEWSTFSKSRSLFRQALGKIGVSLEPPTKCGCYVLRREHVQALIDGGYHLTVLRCHNRHLCP